MVATHLVLTALQSWPLPYLLDQWTATPIWGLMRAASDPFLVSQVALIGTYITLGAGRWWVRLMVGLMLLLFFVLAQMVGTYWLDAGRDSRGFQEFLAQYLWVLTFATAPLLIGRAVSRRRFALVRPLTRWKWQFRIQHLLLITAVVAATLAIIRQYVAWESDWLLQLWTGIIYFPITFVSYEAVALFLLSTTPAILVTAHARSLKWAALVTLIWEVVLSAGFVLCHYASAHLDPPIAVDLDLPYAWAYNAGVVVVATLTMGSTSWITLAAVRSLGYEFLPPPRRGGRQSSEATSAA